MKYTKVAALAAGTLIAAGAAAAPAFADSSASALATNSPGVLSGDVVQIPVHVPVNLCGDTINIIGLLNPAFGNTCFNTSNGN